MSDSFTALRLDPTLAFSALSALSVSVAVVVYNESSLWPLETGVVLLLATSAFLSERHLLFATRRRKHVAPRAGFSGLQTLAIIAMIMACTVQVALATVGMR